LIAYDRDEAGERAAETLAKRLQGEGLECYRVAFPKGMDANEYALKVTPAAKSLGLVLREAVWLGQGVAPQREVGGVCEPASADVLESPSAASTAPSLVAEPVLPEPLPATPVPPAPSGDLDAEVSDTEVVITFGERRYRVRGLAKNASAESLKVNVLVSRGDVFHLDTLDLYHARSRVAYITAAALELQVSEEVVKHDLGKVLLKCEALQAARLQAALAPTPVEAVRMSEAEREEVLELLRDPHLLDRIVTDLEACGLVGETTNSGSPISRPCRAGSRRRSRWWCNRPRLRGRLRSWRRCSRWCRKRTGSSTRR
jgi:hypothetical protein